jgi:hypothetical protein
MRGERSDALGQARREMQRQVPCGEGASSGAWSEKRRGSSDGVGGAGAEERRSSGTQVRLANRDAAGAQQRQRVWEQDSRRPAWLVHKFRRGPSLRRRVAASVGVPGAGVARRRTARDEERCSAERAEQE